MRHTPASAATPRAHFPANLDTPVIVGAVLWLLTLVFFVAQAVTQAAFTEPFSLATNTISDLGATTCGPISVGTYHATVCSPWHMVMNGAFIATGLLAAIGAIATRRAWPARRLTTCGLALLVVGGLGQALAGLSPEDVNPGLHIVGAVLGIPGSQIGMLLLGFAVWRARPWVGAVTLLCGGVGLVSFVLYANGALSATLGGGTMERLAGYPITLWMMAMGAILLISARRERQQLPAEVAEVAEVARASV